MLKWPKSEPEVTKEPVEKQTVTEYTNRLTILWKDGSTTWWDYIGDTRRSNEEAWRLFLKWYHGRKSPVFTISYAKDKGHGSLTFRRADIKRFSLDFEEREKTVDSIDE